MSINTNPLYANLPKPYLPQTITPSVDPTPVKAKRSVWDIVDNVTEIFTKVKDKITPFTPGVNPGSVPPTTTYSNNIQNNGPMPKVGMSTAKKIGIGVGIATVTGFLIWGVSAATSKKKKN